MDWTLIFTGVIAFFTMFGAIAVIWAARLANGISNFVEVFLMPQVIQDSSNDIIRWKILLKNISVYPIYLKSYSLNGIKTDLGRTPIPNNPDSWFGIPISTDVQGRGQFSIAIDFEDYLNKQYKAEGFGKFEGGGWNIHQSKRIQL